MEISNPLSFMKVNFSQTKLCKLDGNKVYTDVDNALVARIYLKNIRHCELHFISNDLNSTYSHMSVYKKTPIPFGIGDRFYLPASALSSQTQPKSRAV